jgi:hypothetical protein
VLALEGVVAATAGWPRGGRLDATRRRGCSSAGGRVRRAAAVAGAVAVHRGWDAKRERMQAVGAALDASGRRPTTA